MLSELPEMRRFGEALTDAEGEYMPSGPPMSPLTSSYLHCWAFYDLAFGLERESIATCVIAVNKALRIDPGLLAAWSACSVAAGVVGGRPAAGRSGSSTGWRTDRG